MVQLHDPRLLEYVGAPESARLTSRSPEYWVLHMGPRGPLHDGDGSVASASRHGDTRTPAVGDVQCLHVLP